MLCSVLVVTLVAAAVEAASISSGSRNYNFDLSGPDLTRLYNQRVVSAELMKRKLLGIFSIVSNIDSDVSHSGVRVTLEDGSRLLIHKGDNFGLSGGNTVVTDARNMSNAWKLIRSKHFGGSKTVADFVAAGGPTYHLQEDNCHHAAERMMDLQ